MFKTVLSTSVLKTDCLIVPVFESEKLDTQIKHLDQKYDGFLSRVIESKDFDGKVGQMNLLYLHKGDILRVLLVGLGKEKDCSLRRWKVAVGSSVTMLQAKKIQHITISLPDFLQNQLGSQNMAEQTVVAAAVADYAYDEYKKEDSRVTHLATLTIFEENKKQHKAIQKGLADGDSISEATNFARELGNTPPGVMTPTFLSEQAKKLAKENKQIKVKVLGQTEIEKLKMGCFLGVAQGSVLEPKFIIVEYLNGKEKEKPTVLVGKGITFDSGGISLKPGDYLTDMKFDMLGGATVLATIKAAAALGLKKNLVALVPACENMPSGTAYRPDDILVAMNGLSVEILNTDGEGRLILADALCYASRYSPKEVIDLATLTGHCLVALGNERSGLFTKDENMCQKLLGASEAVGEQLWRMPLGDEFSDAVKGKVSDLQNAGGVGGPRYGGASIGAAFLEYFTTYPWAHLDLSCSHFGKNYSWVRSGANGFGVQTMVEYLRG